MILIKKGEIVKTHRILFKSKDGINLCGLLTSPGKNSKGAVILSHGITVEKNEAGFYTKLAKLLAENDLTSLRFDFRGHGESSGKSWEMTIKGEIYDLEAAVKVLQSKGFKKIALIGTSFGAGIVTLYARRYPSMVSSIALLCPVLDYKRTFLEPETEWAQEWFTPETISNAAKTGKLNLDGFQLGNDLLKEFRRFKPAETLLKLKVPALIIHGTGDSMVPYSVAKYYGERYHRGTFLPIKGADHGFEGFEKRVYTEVAKWILKHLGC